MALEVQRLQPEAVNFSWETGVSGVNLESQTVTITRPNGSEEVGAQLHGDRTCLGDAVSVQACASVSGRQQSNPT